MTKPKKDAAESFDRMLAAGEKVSRFVRQHADEDRIYGDGFKAGLVGGITLSAALMMAYWALVWVLR